MGAKWDGYTAEFWIETARRTRLSGIRISRTYGYIIRVEPPPPGQKVWGWYATKKIAQTALAELKRATKEGYWACPCGSGKQARLCCW